MTTRSLPVIPATDECTVPRIGDIVVVAKGINDDFYCQHDGTQTRWRVDGYFRMEAPPALDPNDKMTPFMQDLLGKDLNKPRKHWCNREEAETLALVGVCGAEVKVSACTIVGRVPWPDNLIQMYEEASRLRAGNRMLG